MESPTDNPPPEPAVDLRPAELKRDALGSPASLQRREGTTANDSLAEMNNWLLESLRMLDSLLKVSQGELRQSNNVTDIIAALKPILKRILPFEAMAFYTVLREDMSFSLVDVEPAEFRDTIEKQVDYFIDEGTFGWALYQTHPVFTTDTKNSGTLLFHALATRTAVVGMFVGVLNEINPFIPDTVQKLISIVLLNCANIMESTLLANELKDYAQNLEKLVAERTEELRQSREEERSANRAKTLFLASMSHEIRTPLSSIIGFSNLLEKTPLSAKQKEYAEALKLSSQTLMGIINDVLDISKIEAGKMDIASEEVDLRRIAREVFGLLRLKAEQKGLALKSDVSARITRQVRTDPVRLRQILINLVGNAEKFTEQGCITLTAKVLAEDDHVYRVRFAVTDTGIGISAEGIEKLFATFTQVDGSSFKRPGGTGLGLSISDKLVKLLGGDGITVQSEPGKGSVFEFTLVLEKTEKPCRAGEPDITADPHVPTVKPAGQTYRILVVDDVALNVKLAMEILNAHGHTAVGAQNGEEAIALIKRESFDAVLMDMQMPVMDGLESTRLIRKMGLRLPVIAVTAGAMESDRRRCLRAGMNGYITKPVDADAVTKAIANVCSQTGTDEPPVLSQPGWGTTEGYPVDAAKALPRLGWNRKLFKELLDDLAGQSAGMLDVLRHALDTRDTETLRREAHKIKGAAAALNADAVKEIADLLENKGKTGEVTGLKDLVDDLDAEFEEFRAYCRLFWM